MKIILCALLFLSCLLHAEDAPSLTLEDHLTLPACGYCAAFDPSHFP